MSESKTHNKSGKEALSFLSHTHKEIRGYYRILKQRLRETGTSTDGLIEGSPCVLLNSQKGRLTVNSKDVCYGYQLIAWKKFSAWKLAYIRPSKGRTDATISHLCGTRNCCNADHIVVEHKYINDERTHCHFSLRNALTHGGYSDVHSVVEAICTHVPRCASVARNQIFMFPDNDDVVDHLKFLPPLRRRLRIDPLQRRLRRYRRQLRRRLRRERREKEQKEKEEDHGRE